MLEIIALVLGVPAVILTSLLVLGRLEARMTPEGDRAARSLRSVDRPDEPAEPRGEAERAVAAGAPTATRAA